MSESGRSARPVGREDEPISVHCGYCGTVKETQIDVNCGDAILKGKKGLVIDRDRAFWLTVCPACGTVVGVRYVEQ